MNRDRTTRRDIRRGAPAPARCLATYAPSPEERGRAEAILRRLRAAGVRFAARPCGCFDCSYPSRGVRRLAERLLGDGRHLAVGAVLAGELARRN